MNLLGHGKMASDLIILYKIKTIKIDCPILLGKMRFTSK